MSNKIINNVIEALNQVDERFYGINDVAFRNGSLIDSGEIRKLERRFMAEFSIRYSSVIGENKELYKSVDYDFEVPKKFMWYENPDLKIRDTWEKLNNRFQGEIDMHSYWTQEPDFLVHAGQKDKNPENQKLVIEAKVNPNTTKKEALKDIFHTCIYANKYNFQNNVLLLVNINEEKWHTWLSEYIRSNYYYGSNKNLCKIFVIFKENFNAKAKVFCFDEKINK